MSYSDIMNMPTYERRFYIDELLEEINHRNRETESASKSRTKKRGR